MCIMLSQQETSDEKHANKITSLFFSMISFIKAGLLEQ